MINVTRSFLPELSDYIKYLEGIWERGHLTNHGPLVVELENKLRDYLGVNHFFFVNNGTIALQIAIKAADLKGDVVTTYADVSEIAKLGYKATTPLELGIPKFVNWFLDYYNLGGK